MRLSTKLWLRLRSLFLRPQVERELDAELRFHLEQQTSENLAAGMSPDEAHYAALRQIGGLAQFKEECREMRRLSWIENLWQDPRYALRTLRRSPGFTAIAIVSLAFGIGVNTAVFSLIDALLLKAVNVADPDSLVSLRCRLPRGSTTTQFALSTFERLRDQTHIFSGMIAWRESRIAVSSKGAPAEMVGAGFYSGGYYSILGVTPLLGRTFLPVDDAPGQDAVAVISYRYWQTEFSGNPSVLNRTIHAKGIPVRIIGVTPPGFTGLSVTEAYPDIMLPLVWMPRLLLNDDNPSVNITARLKRGWMASRAAVEANVVYSHALAETLEASLPAQRKRDLLARSIVLIPAGRGDPGRWRDYRLRLSVLMGVVAMVLLISCANVANLLLARAAARRREMAVRLAIGARRARLIRQLLTESLLLAVLGGGTGLLLAIWAHRALSHFLGLPEEFALDWRVLGFAAGVCVAAGVLFGLTPALRSTRIDLSAGLKERAVGGGRLGLGKALVILQVALSLLLTIGAGLLIHTLRNLNRVDPGFDQENVLLFWIYPTTLGYEGPKELRIYEEYLRRFNSLPGVVRASMARHNLMQGGYHGAKVSVGGAQTEVAVNAVAPEFFAPMRIPLLAGRDFSAKDREQSPKVAIVSQKFARNHFGSENPLGKRIVLSPPGVGEIEIVGVVRDTRYYSLRQDGAAPSEEIFLPYQQAPRDMLGQMCFALRTVSAPMGVLGAVRREAQAVERNLPVAWPTTQRREVQDSIREERSLAALTSFFGGLTVLLACVGLYGVMSYAIARRTGEIGIRMALGAKRSDVYRLVLGESAHLVAAGVVLGVPAALAATRFLKSVLYGVGPSDPATFVAGVAALTCVTAIAAYLPARRATRVDPTVALRYE